VKKHNSALRSLLIGVAVLFTLVVYAYGFKVTKVNLAETKSEIRQKQLFRILRALAKPDLFEYEQTEITLGIPFYVPCPEGGFTPENLNTDGTYIATETYCANPGELIVIHGVGFEPNVSGPINFIPPSKVVLRIGDYTTDENGTFDVEVKIPKRPEAEVQTIQTVTRTNIGSPFLTQTSLDTWDKIIETVFLALLATTIGTLLAVPLSFFSARNLMRDVTSPLLVVALNLLAIPVGLFIGGQAAIYVGRYGLLLFENLWINLFIVLIGPLAAYYLFRWAVPQNELQKPSKPLRIARFFVLTLVIILVILVLFATGYLLERLGDAASLKLGALSFLGSFATDIGEIIGMIMTISTALVGAAALTSASSKLGNLLLKKVNFTGRRIVTILLSTAAGCAWALIIMGGINWIYEIDDPMATQTIPAIVGASLGLLGSLIYKPKHPVPIGMVVYYISRTIFNILRSIEALVMAIVFVVWVGIGPFAGALALSLHTIAALSKLYSEQVESILTGPIEAILSTGANRLQTVVYAVIPQIIPPYISFTMYRWDINVRMSTIIGFAGGGGIGFLLQQNINLLNYRAASVQMIAIAIVVASMDYLSSKIREKIV
jgi:phosphonate ABC transporter permease subunit PhnE